MKVFLSVDMEVSALYAVAQALNVQCAAVLAISDVLNPSEGWRHFGASPSDLDAGLQPVATRLSEPPNDASSFGDPASSGTYAEALSLAVRASLTVAQAE